MRRKRGVITSLYQTAEIKGKLGGLSAFLIRKVQRPRKKIDREKLQGGRH